MTASFIVVGPNLTIRFEYTGSIQLLSDVANGAAHYLWNNRPHPAGETFELLTDAQKLAILDECIANTFVNLARNDYINTQTQLATIQISADAATKFHV